MRNAIEEKKKYVLVYCINGDSNKTGIIEIDGKPWTDDLRKIDLFTSMYKSNFDLYLHALNPKRGKFSAAVDAYLEPYESEFNPFWNKTDDQFEEENLLGLDVFIASLGKDGIVNVLDPIYKCQDHLVLKHQPVINGRPVDISDTVDLYSDYVSPLCRYIKGDQDPKIVGFPRRLIKNFNSAIEQVGSNLPVLAIPYFDTVSGGSSTFLRNCYFMENKRISLSYGELRNMVSFLTTYYPFAFRDDIDCVANFSETRDLRLKVADIGLVSAGLSYVQPTLFDFGLEKPGGENKGK